MCIENNVGIAVGYIIKQTLTIGSGVVVRANSFVTKDVSPFAIVRTPAKVLK